MGTGTVVDMFGINMWRSDDVLLVYIHPRDEHPRGHHEVRIKLNQEHRLSLRKVIAT